MVELLVKIGFYAFQITVQPHQLDHIKCCNKTHGVGKQRQADVEQHQCILIKHLNNVA